MNDHLRVLYQDTILEHNKNPRHFGSLENVTHQAFGKNPVCGDSYVLQLQVTDGVIQDLAYSGQGCAISKSSCSIMSTVLIGKTVAQAMELFKEFQFIVTSGTHEMLDLDVLGKLAVFVGVREFPARVKCASLGWHTMKAALEEKGEVSTEE